MKGVGNTCKSVAGIKYNKAVSKKDRQIDRIANGTVWFKY